MKERKKKRRPSAGKTRGGLRSKKKCGRNFKPLPPAEQFQELFSRGLPENVQALAELLGDRSWRDAYDRVRAHGSKTDRQRLSETTGRILEACLETLLVRGGEALIARIKNFESFSWDRPSLEDLEIYLLSVFSDLHLGLLDPWHHSVERRWGVVRRGHGYPLIEPPVPTGSLLRRLIDEREWRVLAQEIYSIRDNHGDMGPVLGPASDCDRPGFMTLEGFRAYRGLSIATTLKMCELIPDEQRNKPKGYYSKASWEPVTKIPGLTSPGVKGASKLVEVPVLLRVEKYGATPPRSTQTLEELGESEPLTDLTVVADVDLSAIKKASQKRLGTASPSLPPATPPSRKKKGKRRRTR